MQAFSPTGRRPCLYPVSREEPQRHVRLRRISARLFVPRTSRMARPPRNCGCNLKGVVLDSLRCEPVVLTTCRKTRERVNNGCHDIVSGSDFQLVRYGVHYLREETTKRDSLAFRLAPVRTTVFRIQYLSARNGEYRRGSIAVYFPILNAST